MWSGNQGAAGAQDYEKEFPGFEEQKASGNDVAMSSTVVKGAFAAATGASASKSKYGADVVYDEQDELKQQF